MSFIFLISHIFSLIESNVTSFYAICLEFKLSIDFGYSVINIRCIFISYKGKCAVATSLIVRQRDDVSCYWSNVMSTLSTTQQHLYLFWWQVKCSTHFCDVAYLSNTLRYLKQCMFDGDFFQDLIWSWEFFLREMRHLHKHWEWIYWEWMQIRLKRCIIVFVLE